MHHAPAPAEEAAAQTKTAIIITAQNCFTALPGSGRIQDAGYLILDEMQETAARIIAAKAAPAGFIH
jgi:hypothetical protein